IGREAVEAVIEPGQLELPPMQGVTYCAFVDPSGGSQDSFTLAIAHKDGAVAVLDLVREVRPPFSPESVVGEFAGVLKAFGLSRVTGDRYAGSWPAERFAVHGITYVASELTKRQLYLEALPLINAT